METTFAVANWTVWNARPLVSSCFRRGPEVGPGFFSFTDTEVHLNAKVPREKAKNNPKEFADLNRRSENVLTTNHQGFTLQNG